MTAMAISQKALDALQLKKDADAEQALRYEILSALICPDCGAKLDKVGGFWSGPRYSCAPCGKTYPFTY
jgi:transposase-like protein